MDQNLQQQIKTRIAELPDDVQKAILSADLDTRIQAIGNKHHLHIDQTGKLGDETLLVMLAFSDPNEFVGHLENGLGVSRAEAEGIAQDVSNDVFMPIRESMKEYLEEKSLLETLVGEGGTTPTPAPASKNSPQAPNPATKPPTAAPQPPMPLASHPHDLMLVEKTITTPPTPPTTQAPSPAVAAPPPPKPANYKADPYREPPV